MGSEARNGPGTAGPGVPEDTVDLRERLDPVRTLLHRASTGDAQAAAALVDVLGPRIHGLAVHVTGSPARAEKLTVSVLRSCLHDAGDLAAGVLPGEVAVLDRARRAVVATNPTGDVRSLLGGTAAAVEDRTSDRREVEVLRALLGLPAAERALVESAAQGRFPYTGAARREAAAPVTRALDRLRSLGGPEDPELRALAALDALALADTGERLRLEELTRAPETASVHLHAIEGAATLTVLTAVGPSRSLQAAVLEGFGSPAPRRPPAPPAASGTGTGTGTEEPTSGAAEDAGASRAAFLAAPTVEAAAVPWACVGSVLAASVLSSLLTRRHYVQRTRRAGERVGGGPVVDLDQVRLARREDPAALDLVDRSLRTLAAYCLREGMPIPDLRLALLGQTHLELRTAGRQQLPAPFEATEDSDCWRLARTAELADDASIADVIAPYPALVPLGTTAEGSEVLVDLEHLAATGLEADAATSCAVLRALAVFLATSPWADDLTITTVGVGPELEAALDSGRIRSRTSVHEVLTELEAGLAADQKALAELGHDSAQRARRTGDAGDLWAPQILLLGTDVSSSEQERLRQVLEARPRIGLAVVAAGRHDRPSDGLLTVESLESARLEPYGLDFAPQLLTAADFGRLLRAFSAAATPEAVEPEEEPAGAVLRPLSVVPAPTGTLLTADVRDCAPELPDSAPFLCVLGPLEVLGAAGPLEEKRRAELTETVAYIHLHPGMPDGDFRADLWPGKRIADSTRHQRISRLRSWLGSREDGEPYLPRARGVDGSYAFGEHVSSDWALVQEVARDRRTTSAEQLAEALKLVRSRPFEDAGRARYRWAIPLQYRMTDAILDLAHELAQRALEVGDTESVLWATERGLLVEPLHEQLWRDRLRAGSSDQGLHRRITHELEALIDEIDDGYDLLPETESLMSTTPASHRIAL